VRGKRASAGEAKAARASEIAGEAGRRMKIIRFSPVVFPSFLEASLRALTSFREGEMISSFSTLSFH
jgi:hypothetical protein